MSDTFISREKVRALEERMESLGIREDDIEERFVRARGRGGQKVNKTSSCVHIRHVPTGIEVKCDASRSRQANRFFARRILADRFEDIVSPETSPKRRAGLRTRKQKARRAARARKKVAARCDGGVNEEAASGRQQPAT
ncbi:MAG TPA: peptide chain release factor-like protein [Deltaproteobacteria bacterium]|nr:peptide chain release factor-like protein [Deltaproteobacteria bacterium]